YFQKRTDVEQLTELRPLVRRCTGGGLVRHDSDWTYSLAIPATHAWYRLPAEVSYKILHQWIQRSLHRIGVSTQLSPCCAKAIPGACFAGPEKFDLTLEDRKIAGAAQRRSREGLLIQGSLQGLPSQSDRSAWMQAMADCADPALSNPGVKSELPQPVLVEAGGLERGRYTPSSGFQTRR
ncbi:MAG: hypothetical protein FJ405_06815, partial [Verrucomicrobia bacterium]|nr:hypothetical protein [Verrucomicrobiota bacterium]